MLRQYEQENPAAWLELVRIVVATQRHCPCQEILASYFFILISFQR